MKKTICSLSAIGAFVFGLLAFSAAGFANPIEGTCSKGKVVPKAGNAESIVCENGCTESLDLKTGVKMAYCNDPKEAKCQPGIGCSEDGTQMLVCKGTGDKKVFTLNCPSNKPYCNPDITSGNATEDNFCVECTSDMIRCEVGKGIITRYNVCQKGKFVKAGSKQCPSDKPYCIATTNGTDHCSASMTE